MGVATLASLPSRSDLLVDANVMVYAATGASPQCRALMERCRSEDVYGFTTCEAVNEACHKLMIIEAAGKSLIPRQTAAALRTRRDAIPLLSEYWAQITLLIDNVLSVMPMEEDRLRAAHAQRRAYAVLTNDSMILAAASDFGIGALATADGDFDLVPWLTAYKPTDLP